MDNNPSYSNNSKIAFRTQSGIKITSHDEILYCKGEGRYTTIYLKNGHSLLVSRLLKSIEDILMNDSFYRIHKSYIVNMKYIKEFKHPDYKYVVLENDIQLEIAKRRKSQFIKKLSSLFIIV